MGCGASAQHADAAGSGYATTEQRESAASRQPPLVVDVESARTLAPPGAAAAGPPSLNTLEAKHSSLADNWEKQRRESQKVQRQSSRDRLDTSPISTRERYESPPTTTTAPWHT